MTVLLFNGVPVNGIVFWNVLVTAAGGATAEETAQLLVNHPKAYPEALQFLPACFPAYGLHIGSGVGEVQVEKSVFAARKPGARLAVLRASESPAE